MSLQILIIDSSNLTRKVAQGYILTEFNDAITHVAASAEDAIRFSERNKYNAILCGHSILARDDWALLGQIRATEKNQDTRVIVMTDSTDTAQVSFLLEQGIRHILSLPFTALQLRELLNQVCDLRKFRAYPRYTIDNTAASILSAGKQVEAEVINISMRGLFCAINYPQTAFDLLTTCKLAITFPSNFSEAPASDIEGQILRLQIDSWREDLAPCTIRCAWKFVNVPPAADAVLESVLEKARKELALVNEAASRLTIAPPT